MTTELKMPHPVISMSHMNIKSLTFSNLIVSTSKNETKIISSCQFSSKGRYHQSIHCFYDFMTSYTSGFLQSLLILMRLICIISVYFCTVLRQNKKMIQILITSTKKVSEAICLNNWWHCSRIARLTLKPCCVPDRSRHYGDQGRVHSPDLQTIQTNSIGEHTGRTHGGDYIVCVGVVCSY